LIRNTVTKAKTEPIRHIYHSQVRRRRRRRRKKEEEERGGGR